MYLALTALPNWHSLQQPLYLLLAAVLLLFGVGLGWLGITLRRGVKSGTTRPKVNRMATMTPLLQSKAGRIGKTALVLILGAVLGWSFRGYQYDRARVIYQREHDAWKQRDAENMREHAAYQQAVEAWKARQKENR